MPQGLMIRTDLIKKNNYNYITRFKFCLSLYPLLKLTRTPFKDNCNCFLFFVMYFYSGVMFPNIEVKLHNLVLNTNFTSF